jgi:uncharacterized protein (DUF427 family)
MALTVGTGPFGRAPAGEFNVAYDAPAHVLYLEDSPRRVRVVVAGETVAQSSRARLLHETGLAPVYYLPEADVRAELLEPSERTTHCPFKGDASYWTIRVGDVQRPDAVWSYPEPLPEAPPLAGHLAFRWDAIDEWWEEAERIGVHPRDPYHRCDAIRSDRHVVVRVGGEVVADSRRPTVLFETGLPPRFYLPLDDVELDRLERTGTETSCPYKGTTSRYYTVDPAGQRLEDVAWSYDEPRAEVAGNAGPLASTNEEVALEGEGEPENGPSPRSPERPRKGCPRCRVPSGGWSAAARPTIDAARLGAVLRQATRGVGMPALSLATTAVFAYHPTHAGSEGGNLMVLFVFLGVVATAAWLMFSELKWIQTVSVAAGGWVAGLSFAFVL